MGICYHGKGKPETQSSAPSLAEYKENADRMLYLAQGANGYSGRAKEKEMSELLGEKPVGTEYAFTKKVPAPIGSAEEWTTVTYLARKVSDEGEEGTGTWELHEHWSEHPFSPGRTYANASTGMSGAQLRRLLHDELYDEGGDRSTKSRPATGYPFRSRGK